MEITFSCGVTVRNIGPIAMACRAHKCNNAACQKEAQVIAKRSAGYMSYYEND